MRKQVLHITAVSVSVLLLGASYFHLRRKHRDRLAAKLLRELTLLLQPATAGLLAEKAFQTSYPEKAIQKAKGPVVVLKSSTANRFARRIHGAFGAWYQGGDDESRIYGVFRQLRDKIQVAQVASAYQQLYKINLIDKLYEQLDEHEVSNILTIVNPLPAQRTRKAVGNPKTITEPDWENPWHMSFLTDVKRWMAPMGIRELALEQAKKVATALYHAKGKSWFHDDKEAVVEAVFRQLKDKIQLTNISAAFWKTYQRDLWQFLKSFLSKKEMERYVQRPVKELPNFFTLTSKP